MKKILIGLSLILVSFGLSGCWPNQGELSTTRKPEDYETVQTNENQAETSKDDPLEVIEEKIDDAELEDFEQELEALEEEINQL